jgi:hypothetical protein
LWLLFFLKITLLNLNIQHDIVIIIFLIENFNMIEIEEIEKAIRKNDINKVKSLLNDKRVDPSKSNNWLIQIASKFGFFDIVELLLTDKRIDPSDIGNLAISYAYKNQYFNIVDLLWEDNRVKETLEKNEVECYQYLIKKDIKNKISHF